MLHHLIFCSRGLTSLNVGTSSCFSGGRKANGTVSFNDEEVKKEGKKEWKRTSEMPLDACKKSRVCGIASCVITCLIYFTSQKLSAMTEPIYSDPRASVRQTKGRLQWNCSPQPLMESQWTPKPAGPREQTVPAIRAEDQLCPNTPRLGPSVIIASLSQGETAPGWKKGKKPPRKGGGYANLDLCTLTLARYSSVEGGSKIAALKIDGAGHCV